MANDYLLLLHCHVYVCPHVLSIIEIGIPLFQELPCLYCCLNYSLSKAVGFITMQPVVILLYVVQIMR